jgi:hypothetical protein
VVLRVKAVTLGVVQQHEITDVMLVAG